MRVIYLVAACALVSSLPSAVQAQYIYNAPASTVGESYARGWADVVRSQGQYELLNSQAAINYEQARQAQIQSRYAYARNYFEMREMNKAYTAALRGPRPTTEQLIRYAEAGAPDPLTAEQLNPNTGQLNWPAVLQMADFAAQRQLVEQLFGERALSRGHVSPEEYSIFSNSMAQMEQLLKAKIHDVSPKDYLQAKNFLASLAYEATY